MSGDTIGGRSDRLEELLVEALPGLDDASLTEAADEAVFDRATLTLAGELRTRVAVLAATQRVANGELVPWSRNEAVLCGMTVRIAKLLTAFAGHLAKREAEAALQLARPIVETAVNLRYLIAADDERRFESFIAHSFVNDRRLRTAIDGNIEKRGGAVLPIEARIIGSIDRRLAQAGIRLEDVPMKPSPDWALNFRARLEALDGPDAYVGVFGPLSAYTHGSWHELVIYHLVPREGGFAPSLNWSDTRPQMGLSVAIMVALAAESYLVRMLGDDEHAAPAGAVFRQASEQALRLHELHEAYVARTGGPALEF